MSEPNYTIFHRRDSAGKVSIPKPWGTGKPNVFFFSDGYPYNFSNAELYATTCGPSTHPHPYANFGPSPNNVYQPNSWNLSGSGFIPPGSCAGSNSSLDGVEINKLVSLPQPIHSNSFPNMSVHYGNSNLISPSNSQYDITSHCSASFPLNAGGHHMGHCTQDGK